MIWFGWRVHYITTLFLFIFGFLDTCLGCILTKPSSVAAAGKDNCHWTTGVSLKMNGKYCAFATVPHAVWTQPYVLRKELYGYIFGYNYHWMVPWTGVFYFLRCSQPISYHLSFISEGTIIACLCLWKKSWIGVWISNKYWKLSRTVLLTSVTRWGTNTGPFTFFHLWKPTTWEWKNLICWNFSSWLFTYLLYKHMFSFILASYIFVILYNYNPITSRFGNLVTLDCLWVWMWAWVFVSLCQPRDEAVTCPGCMPSWSCDSWDGLKSLRLWVQDKRW